MEGWPLAILDATIVRTSSQRVAVVAATDAILASEADTRRYRDTLEAAVFPGLDVVLLGTEPSGGVRLIGPPTAVASLQEIDVARLRFHRYDLRRPA